jgi:hypothetical protein
VSGWRPGKEGLRSNFGELRKGEVQHSPAPIGPGSPAKDAHIAGYYAPEQPVQPGMARALGPWQSTSKGWSLPAKLQPFTPLFERSCVYFIAA